MSSATTKVERTRLNPIVIILKIDSLSLLTIVRALGDSFASLIVASVAGMFIPSLCRTEPAIEFRDVGLDIQEGCAIKHVNFPDSKDVAVDRIQSDNGEANWIWPVEVPYGKKALALSIQKGSGYEGIPVSTVKMVNKNQVRKAGDIFQALNILWEHFYFPVTIRAEHSLDRRLGLISKRSMYNPYRLISH